MLALDVNEEGLKATEESVKAVAKDGGEIMTRKADVRDIAQLKAAVADAVAAWGQVDCMVNNAGTMPLAHYSDHEAALQKWYDCIDINMKGVLNGTVAVYDQMIKQGRGQVINLSSIYGNFPVIGAAVYGECFIIVKLKFAASVCLNPSLLSPCSIGATKAAVCFLSESLRVESQGKIKVTTIKPTGVPGTNLGSNIVNRDAFIGILGQKAETYIGGMMKLAAGEAEEGWTDPNDPRYFALNPTYIADAIMVAIDQPWGVSLGEITVRATGDGYIL